MKRKLSLFLLAFFAVAAFAAQPSKKAMVEKSYTITFQETGTESDSDQSKTEIDDIIDQGAEYVSEISATKVFNARAGRGVKLGSSSAIGELKLTLAEVVKPSKIVVKARKYNDKGENYISINDNEFTLSAGDGEDCVIEYDGETEVSEIDIKTSSAKPRTYVISVSVFYSEDTGEDPVSVYTITGAVADAPYYGVEEPSFFGTAWDATVTANDLVKGEDGLYTKTYENVYLLASHFIFYQVVKDRTETLGSKKKEMITSDGTYNVVFTFNPEDNSVSVALNSTAEPAPVYTLVGSVKESKYIGEQEASFFGEAWAPNFSSNDMEKGADGIYTKSFNNVQLLAQNYIEYKVVKNHDYANGEWGFGSNNANYIVTEDGEYNITFKFNPDAAFDNGYNVDVVVEKITPQPQLNTYEVYVSNVPEGFGRPYAYVWSVVDGVDVPVTAWPGTRMGPWQFDNGDMGYIFQVQAADAPQFIIFNNGQSGEGNQTADLEFVNRETYDLTELMTPPVVEDAVYTITGAVSDAPIAGMGSEEASFFGTAWDATVTANDLVKGEDGKYTKTFENVYLQASHFVMYRVVKNRTENIGSVGKVVVVSDGLQNVTFTFNPEDNSVTCDIQSAVVAEPVYTLVGGVNTTEGGQEDVLFGTTWEPTLEANDMEKGADGIYTKSFEKVALSYGDQILYKVAKNHAWSETWGFGTENADYSIQDDGEYNITFKFNPDAAFDNGYNVDVVVEKIQPVLNTYEVYVSNVPEGFGRPYAYVWSVVDGENVPVAAWPGTRMGPWQFDNGDMGYIFQVQAADAPQFIIFNNGQSGEGNQTADLVFVNRETYDLTELMTPPVVDEDVLVEVPADAVIETDWHFDGIYRTSQGASDVTDNTEVAFVGNDVYVKGIPYYFTDSWMKGTISDGKAVFASGQFVGEDDYGKEYMLGYDGENIVDIVFSYDEENHIFSLETPYILENGDSKTELSMWGYYTYLDIIKGEVIPDEPVVAPADLVTEDYVFASEELSFDDNEEPVYEDYSADVKVGFDGNDVYVQGLCYYLPDSWVKGVKDGSTVTFEAGQFFGTIYDQYDMYFVGYGESGIENVVMNYDETTGEFTTDHWILINSKKASISYYNIYTSCRLTKVGPATAIQSVEDTEEAGTVYYDTLGRRTNSNTKGLLLKQVRQADGSVKTKKVARK